jgi:hypothetical protein
LKAKGGTSLWFRDEMRLHDALAKMLVGGGVAGETGVEQEAWDAVSAPSGFRKMLQETGKSAEIAPGFVEKLKRATFTFKTLFPFERWYVQKNCRQDPTAASGYAATFGVSNCLDGGMYSCWRMREIKYTPVQLNILTQLAGKFPAADREWLATGKHDLRAVPSEGKDRWSPGLAAWLKHVEALIRNVPGGHGQQGATQLPRKQDLWVWDGNVLRPSAWTQAFLDTFGVDKRKVSAAKVASKFKIGLRAPTKFRPVGWTKESVAAALLAAQEQETQADEGSEDDETSGSKTGYIIAGVAAVALLGGAAYWYSRRRR